MPDTQTLAVDLQRDCPPCAQRLAAELERQPGVVAASAASATLQITFDPERSSGERLETTARQVQVDLDTRFAHQELRIDGMDCADCARTIDRAVRRIPGVQHTDVSFAAARIRYEYEPGGADPDTVAGRIRSLGYRVALPGQADGPDEGPAWWQVRQNLTAISALLLALALPVDLFAGSAWLSVPLFLAAIVIGALPVARSGINALRATHRPDINLLMFIAAVGAVAIGAWVEAALVVVLFSVGELLEGRAVERARRELAALVSLAPDTARVQQTTADGQTEVVEILVAELQVGDVVHVRPGERIPVDGEITEGSSAVDQAAITGESTPVDRGIGDGVFAGTLNGQGLLIVRVDADPGDSTLAKIGRLVVEAQARRSPSERWVDRFATIYTPIVMGAAVLLALGSPLLGADWGDAFYNALALLILACPCALVISTPVAIVSSLARASAAGVLVKGGANLEAAAAVTVVAFDKTGTLTTGHPRVVSVHPLRGTSDEVLRLAGSLEQGSEHPLAKAILGAARERKLALPPVTDFQARTGLGACARVEDREVLIGNPRLFGSLEQDDPRVAAALDGVRASGATAVLVVADDVPIGVIGLADEARPEARQALADLRALRITRTVMLTGDNDAAGQAIGLQLGVGEVRAELMPQDKSDAITSLGPTVAMVGDGVNDAPALAAASLGIAMGSAGSDAAIEVADIALMGDDPRKVAGLIGTARWTRTIVRQNIAFSLITKLAALIVLALGALPLWGAVVTDVGASLIVVANGLRLLRGRPVGQKDTPMLPAAARMLPMRNSAPAPCADDCCAPAATAARHDHAGHDHAAHAHSHVHDDHTGDELQLAGLPQAPVARGGTGCDDGCC